MGRLELKTVVERPFPIIVNIFAQTLHSAKAIKSSVSDTITEWNSQVLIYVIGNITSFYGFFV